MTTKHEIITKRQKEVLTIIYDNLITAGFPPSFSELKEKLNVSSNQTILDIFSILEKKNLISREEGSARGIKILRKGYKTINAKPLAPVVGITSAGSFTEAIEEIDAWKPLSKDVETIADNVLIVRVMGDSMINANINDGDLILFKKTNEVVSGDIVLVQTPDGTTVKRFISQHKPPHKFLKPENPKYQNISFTNEMEIIGKMVKKDNVLPGQKGHFIETVDNWKEKFLNRIVCGDSHFLLQEIPSNSVNLVITSPPYFQQRDYDGLGIGNEKRTEEYLDNLLKIFNECVRITKDDGSIIFNLGDKYENSSLLMVPHKFAIEAIKKNPIKLVNIITWVKLNPTPRQFKRRLVSSTEPFFHFVKNDSYYYDVDSFMEHKNLLRSKSNGGNKIGQRYFELIEKSSLSEKERQQSQKELLEVIQEVKSNKIESFRMKIRGMHSEPFGGQEGGRKIQLEKKGFTIIKILGNGLKKDVIECPVETIKGSKHPAIYPEYIIQELIKLLTRKGDIVIDPFTGSGTTAVAAKKLKRDYIGIDISPNYCKYAECKLKDIKTENNLLEFLI